MKFDKSQLLLYAVTDRGGLHGKPLSWAVEQAIAGGVTMVQLREKEMDNASFLAEAREIGAICKKYRIPFLINDNVEVALACGADGVHVGLEDLPPAEIRRRCGKDFIIGATAKTVEQAKAAEAAGADYLGVGAVYPSPTKQNAVRITSEMLREIAESVSIPIVAIGGLNAGNLPPLAGSGIAGAAVVSALFSREDPQQAAEELRQILQKII